MDSRARSSPCISCPDRTPCRRPTGVKIAARRAAAEAAAGRRLHDCAGHDARGNGRNQRDRRDAADRHRPGDHRRVRLPARLARDAHPTAGRAGLSGRDVCRCSRSSASPSTRFRCSDSFWRSAWSSTTQSSWWRRSSITSKKGCRRRRRRSRRWRRSRGRWSASRWCSPRCSFPPHSSRVLPAASISNSR